MLVVQTKKKTDYNTKPSEIEKELTNKNHGEYITTSEFNRLTTEHLATRLAQLNLATKIVITNFDDQLRNLNKKVMSNKTQYLLVENKFKNLKPFYLGLFIGQSYFNNDRTQPFSIFQPICKTISTFFGLSDIISEWESEGLSNEKFKPPYTTNKSLSPKLSG